MGCHKTKFNLFFNRKQQCQLCQRNVCSRCISKAKLPEVSNVPVNALSPVSNGQHHEMSLHHPQPTSRRPSLIEQTTSNVRLRRSNTLGRYDRPRSIHGDHVPTSNGLFSSLSSSTTSSSSMLNVCLDCKNSVEIMTKSKPSPNSKIDHQAPQVPFHQRRHSSLSHHHQFQHRRSLVTRSMYLDNEY